MIRGIFTDFFDVIAPGSLRSWLASQGKTEDRVSLELSARSDRGELTSEQYFREAAKEFGVSYEQLVSDITAQETIDEDMVALFDQLKVDYPLVLITNSSAEYLRHLLQAFDLEKLFTHILVSAEIGMVKPELDIFQTALEVSGLRPEETVFIDDREVNVAGAEALGINGIVHRGYEETVEALRAFGVEL